MRKTQLNIRSSLSLSYYLNAPVLIILLLVVFASSLIACESNNKQNQPQTQHKHEGLNQVSNSDSISVLSGDSQIILHLNKEQVRRFQISTDFIRDELNQTFSNSKISLDQILDKRLRLPSKDGKIIQIPLKSILDTAYYQNSP